MTFIFSIIIFLFLNIVIHNIETNCGKSDSIINSKDVFLEDNNKNEIIENAKNQSEQKNDDFNWYIEIPAISVKAPIQESIKMDVLNEFVGHFVETSKGQGNIGLAGHNRGYKKNYFENLNKLKIGDEIKYKYKEFEGTYHIEKIETIKSTDWSYLEESPENRITLITCIENKPDLRLCIQGVQK